MPFSLGNWADQLRCDICDEFPSFDLDLDYPPPADAYGNEDSLPDDFWDPPPNPPDDGFEFPDPDYWPSAGFPDMGDGFILNFNGKW